MLRTPKEIETELVNLYFEARRARSEKSGNELNRKISNLRIELKARGCKDQTFETKETLNHADADFCEAPGEPCFCLKDFSNLGLCGHCCVKLAEIITAIQRKAKEDGIKTPWKQKTVPEILAKLDRKRARELLKQSVAHTVKIQ